MRLGFPLYARILLWFFLNLVLLGVAFVAFFGIQFHAGLDSLLVGPAGERIERLSQVIAFEMRQNPREKWTEILKRFNAAYGIQFFLLRPDGGQTAGEKSIELPAEIRRRLGSVIPLPRRPPRGGPEPLLDEPRDEKRPGPFDMGPPPRPLPKFMARTTHPTRYWVVVRLPFGGPLPPPGPPQVLVAMSETLSAGGLFIDFRPWLAAGFGAVILSVLFWLPLVRGITRSISQMTRATEQLAAGHFEVRVQATRRDELGRLGEAVNQMAARLDGFVSGQKRFLGDAAHELCSPLSRIQLALGILEQHADPKQQTWIADLREEVQHMSSLVNELLSFSKASLQRTTPKLQPVSLREIAQKTIQRECLDNANIHNQIAKGCDVLAEPELLCRALSNLLRNAVRYAGQAGPITVSARCEDHEVSLTVADCGPGVPENELTRIFDPFYRLDPSRDASTGGIGLGLAIVKTCVESCQGTVSCRNRVPSGLEVTLTLPAAT